MEFGFHSIPSWSLRLATNCWIHPFHSCYIWPSCALNPRRVSCFESILPEGSAYVKFNWIWVTPEKLHGGIAVPTLAWAPCYKTPNPNSGPETLGTGKLWLRRKIPTSRQIELGKQSFLTNCHLFWVSKEQMELISWNINKLPLDGDQSW